MSNIQHTGINLFTDVRNLWNFILYVGSTCCVQPLCNFRLETNNRFLSEPTSPTVKEIDTWRVPRVTSVHVRDALLWALPSELYRRRLKFDNQTSQGDSRLLGGAEECMITFIILFGPKVFCCSEYSSRSVKHAFYSVSINILFWIFCFGWGECVFKCGKTVAFVHCRCSRPSLLPWW